LIITRDEDKSTKKNEDVKYMKVWKINEIKEGHLNKEQVQDIVFLGTVVQDESTDRKKEVNTQKYVERTNEDDNDSTSKQTFF
jgi:hypothetical protein